MFKESNISGWDNKGKIKPCKAIWDEVVKAYEKLPPKWLDGKNGRKIQWIFRGQKNNKWHLRTALERSIIDVADDEGKPRKNGDEEEKLDEFYKMISGKLENKFEIECRLLREFKRKSHHYTDYAPKEGNLLEWLALMRHYESPTRLLDFVYSFFVALYFALEEAEGECAVWAFDSRWIEQKYDELTYRVKKKPKTTKKHRLRDEVENAEQIKEKDFNDTFWNNNWDQPVNAVRTANPYRLNKRLVAQQGLFLYPTNINISFQDNLKNLVGDNTKESQEPLRKFNIKASQSQRNDMLRRLHNMNINRATLFPDLGGFARFMRTLLAFPEFIAF